MPPGSNIGDHPCEPNLSWRLKVLARSLPILVVLALLVPLASGSSLLILALLALIVVDLGSMDLMGRVCIGVFAGDLQRRVTPARCRRARVS